MSDDTISIVRPADSTDSTLAFPVHTTNPGSEGTRSAPTAGPVFVDASGRRRRRVRRLGLILMVLAAGYLTLVVSTALGGPTVDAPFLPLPAPPDATARHASGHVPSVKHRTAPGSGGTTGSGTRPDSAVSTARPGSAASSASASPSSASSASASASPTGSASAGPSASASPGQTTAAPTANGKSHASTAPGASHRPVKS
ncbi:hypothetical protein [Actinacidiphila oryziradicis]|uniref:Bi-functional transferase/deacetylase n=1 Tax=Actinacidiphila oryziradicis TaxID=2571141 RepID=A0A4U0RVP7_9ACTN|nr:hypothetical protein [Actinacidiphila oryziradicis]TJZ99627.1 hypothetical protein FCI23_45015 [Actinacidiphila oryziradicis]